MMAADKIYGLAKVAHYGRLAVIPELLFLSYRSFSGLHRRRSCLGSGLL
jgi:hypothetical protein